MRHLESLLGENDLSNVAFSIIERFSVHQCLQVVLVDLFNMIGWSLKLWTDAEEVSHVFVNPSLGSTLQAHRWLCRPGAVTHNVDWYEDIPARPPQPTFSPTSEVRSWEPRGFVLPERKDDDLIRVALSEQLRSGHVGPVWVTQFDFGNRAPLGWFAVTWLRETPPLTDPELAHVQNTLWNLARVVSALLCNHYTVHKNTYLPSYQLEGPQTAAILFADIRNSTAFFEIARLGGDDQMERVEILLRAWFRYAAELIVGPGLGNLHRFTGDGLVATFGEYAMGNPAMEKGEIGCMLALHAARCLVESFQALYDHWRAHPDVMRFLRDINEDIELDVGIGVNYGKIRFGYVGRSVTQEEPGSMSLVNYSSHLEYTAFGDHMNTASRLADAASKLEAELDVSLRGTRFHDHYRLMSVLASHAASVRLKRALNMGQLEDRKGMIRMKGKGHGLSFYEIDLKEVDQLRCAHLLKDAAGGQYARYVEQPPELGEHLDWLSRELDIMKA